MITCFQEAFIAVLTLPASAGGMFSAFHHRSWHKTQSGGAQRDEYCMHTLFPDIPGVYVPEKLVLSSCPAYFQLKSWENNQKLCKEWVKHTPVATGKPCHRGDCSGCWGAAPPHARHPRGYSDTSPSGYRGCSPLLW